jgi:hypothetical protein
VCVRPPQTPWCGIPERAEFVVASLGLDFFLMTEGRVLRYAAVTSPVFMVGEKKTIVESYYGRARPVIYRGNAMDGYVRANYSQWCGTWQDPSAMCAYELCSSIPSRRL